MGLSTRNKKEIFSEINITPLTDIFLVLLIIMMVIAPLLDQQGLNLMVPNETEAKQDKQLKTISIDVSKDDKYNMDGKDLSVDSLISVIRDAAKEKKDGLLIQSDGDATHGAVVKLMDAARTAGVTNISVIEK